ncbi:hypothetical protein NL676_035922 [Syzygium grande]|nr:hypothetical protein NL676_035922 [Syzygium grande]
MAPPVSLEFPKEPAHRGYAPRKGKSQRELTGWKGRDGRTKMPSGASRRAEASCGLPFVQILFAKLIVISSLSGVFFVAPLDFVISSSQ